MAEAEYIQFSKEVQDESYQNVCTVSGLVTGTELMLRQYLKMGDVNVYVPKEIATQSDPSSDEYEEGDTVIVGHEILKSLILQNKSKVKIAPILVTAAGIPHSGKSTAILNLFSHLEKACTANPTTNESHIKPGISYYELESVGLEPFKHVHYSSITPDTCYLYAVESALKRRYYLRGQSIKVHEASVHPQSVFEDDLLDEHFKQIFANLWKSHQGIIGQDRTTFFNRSLPSGLALINVWDLGLNKGIFHFLPALYGHLSSSYMWLFLDLQRDVDCLYDPPAIHENHPDKNVLMRWRSRLHYLLCYSKLATSKKHSRSNVCSLLGTVSEDIPASEIQILIDKCKKEVNNAAPQIGVQNLINDDFHAIVPTSEGCFRILKETSDKIASTELQSAKKIPLSWIFLRSVFYGKSILYIKKDDLRGKAKQLNIENDRFHAFCEFFTSFGSIIDVSLLDSSSNYIITEPVMFLHELDKLFYPVDDLHSKLQQFGIVSSETAENIFKEHWEFFMEVLISANLVVKLDPDKISFSDTTQYILQSSCYYIPIACTTPPILTCDRSALHLQMSVDFPVTHFQVHFTRHFLAYNSDAKVFFTECNQMNATTYVYEAIHFDLIHHGEDIEFCIPDCDEQITLNMCTAIINSCHEVIEEQLMKRSFEFNFSIICSAESKRRHLLPDDVLCSACHCNGKLDKQINTWNYVLRQNKWWENVPQNNGDSLLLLDVYNLAAALQDMSHDSLEVMANVLEFENGLNNPMLANLKKWRLILTMIMQWENALCDAGSQNEPSKYVLARKLKMVAETDEIPPKDRDILLSQARGLDMKVTLNIQEKSQN